MKIKNKGTKMKTIELENGQLRQIPETEMEKAMLLELLRGRFEGRKVKTCIGCADGTREYEFTLSYDNPWDSEGRLLVNLVDTGWDVMRDGFGDPSTTIEIYLWVNERTYPASEAYRLVVGWDLPENGKTNAQSNTHPYMPILIESK